ncbi:hypothetical protein EW146_g786 [Bondarzewia mesenterica]|uniref:Uncharacterized protein n=1 Tax=Bondarzewia mesenterica TaxID=1095465 RepID=A0A4S4M6B1_9AGAM|nr:hypothetical protein EW146_g786 [Bondarzewia mesenterica]
MTVDTHVVEPPEKLSAENVQLGSGPPTREELLVYYPSKFTWQQMKTFVNAGDLGLLKRDKKLQKRYQRWAVGIKERYGSMVNYLLSYRLQWGKPDALSKLRSQLDRSSSQSDRANSDRDATPSPTSESQANPVPSKPHLPQIPPDAKGYFTADISAELISIIQNDWPYSVPAFIEHTLIWTVVPILPPDLPPSINSRLHQDGIWGFTGLFPDSPPPSPSLLPTCLPALAEWGVTESKLTRSAKGTEEEERTVKEAGAEVQNFVCQRWVEREWETAWFVNPPASAIPQLNIIWTCVEY